MNKSNKTEQQFFMLLRAGLWETDVRLESICDDDFAEIKRIAEEQSVTGIIAAGIEGRISNACHTIANGNGGQAPAIRESRAADAGHAIGFVVVGD